MKSAELVEPDDAIKLAEHAPGPVFRADVVTGGEDVGRIETDAKALRFARVLYYVRDLLKSVPQAGTLSRGRLQGDACLHLWNLAVHAVDGSDDRLQAGLFPGAEMRARMQNEERQLELMGAGQFLRESADGVGVELRIGRGQVDQIIGVGEDGRQFGALPVPEEGVNLRLGQGPGEPLHIILHENLHGGALDGAGAFDGHVRAAADGHVSAQQDLGISTFDFRWIPPPR